MPYKQLKAWRVPMSLTYITSGQGDLQSSWTQLMMLIRMALDIDDWSVFERTCQSLFKGLVGYGDRGRFVRRARPCTEEFTLYGEGGYIVAADDKSVYLYGVDGVCIRASTVRRDGDLRMVCELMFVDQVAPDQYSEDEPRALPKVLDRRKVMMRIDESVRTVGSEVFEDIAQRDKTVWERAVYITATHHDHYVFARGNFERLGDRVRDVAPRTTSSRHHPVWRITPLEGEDMAVFASSGASELGMEVEWQPSRRSQVSDPLIFAKVGRISLKFRPADRGKRNSRDRILVFGG